MKNVGYYTAIAVSVIGLVTFVIAYNTPPLSGPLCQGECFQYPYLDIASRFPRDYWWMYPAMILTIVYLMLMNCIHQAADKSKNIWSRMGLMMAALSTGILLTDYFAQIAVIQPSLLLGETDGISLLTQFNPHGVFIALEELGFGLMSLSFLFMALTFVNTGIERAIRRVFLTNFGLTLSALIIMTMNYGMMREYRFEIAVISINWMTLIVGGILLSKWFKNSKQG